MLKILKFRAEVEGNPEAQEGQTNRWFELKLCLISSESLQSDGMSPYSCLRLFCLQFPKCFVSTFTSFTSGMHPAQEPEVVEQVAALAGTEAVLHDKLKALQQHKSHLDVASLVLADHRIRHFAYQSLICDVWVDFFLWVYVTERNVHLKKYALQSCMRNVHVTYRAACIVPDVRYALLLASAYVREIC